MQQLLTDEPRSHQAEDVAGWEEEEVLGQRCRCAHASTRETLPESTWVSLEVFFLTC